MTNFSRARAAVFAAVVLAPAVALPINAFAQTTPAKTHGGMAAVLKNNSKNVEAHIAQLHQTLGITPAEEPLWGSFAQVMRDNATQMDAAFTQRGQALATMNAVQDMQSYAQIAQVQSASMQKLSTAFETLYASFPAAQKQVADALFRPKMMKAH